MAADAIDPATVPRRTLWTGSTMPALGLGTFGSDRFTGEQVAAAVLEAASVGYRHFDCASVYGNEHLIGNSFRAILEAGISREDLWVTSKVWNDKHGEGDVIASCEQSLRDLQLDYLDLYLVHWPFPNDHPPGCDIHSRSSDAKPYVHDNFMTTWRQMEALVDRGLVRHIGTSNMTIPKLRLVLRDARIKPACNQMELHPHFQQPALFQFVGEQGMVPIGYCPIGSPNRPDRDRDRHGRCRRPGHCTHCKAAGRRLGSRVHQVGRPARSGADSFLREAGPIRKQPEGRRCRSSHQSRNE